MANWLTRLREDSVIRTNILLVLLGAALLLLYRVGLSANAIGDIKWFVKVALGQSAIYLVAAWIIFRARSSRSTLLLVIVFSVLFRLSVLFSPPFLSGDIYRYVWDGRVQSAGINPYRYIPAAPELAHLRDDAIYPKINRREYAHTIYPPVAETLFFLTTRISESVTWMKLTMLGFELIAIWTIVHLLASFGMPRERFLIYAWHPLIVWEFAGSGHLDAVAIAFIALAFLARHRNANFAAGCALACATLIKLFPVVLIPAVYKRWGWKMPVAFALTIVVAYLPYLGVGLHGVLGFLPGYAQEEGLVGGGHFYALNVARTVFGANVSAVAFLVFALMLMSAVAVWALFRDIQRQNVMKSGMVLATAATALFAPRFSWYFAWLVPFLCFAPSLAVFYLTATSFVLYFGWLIDSPDQMFRLNSFLYAPFLLLAAVEFWFHYSRFRFVPLRQPKRTAPGREQTIDNPGG
jgi:alpha-1,6-mannosyltransferase